MTTPGDKSRKTDVFNSCPGLVTLGVTAALLFKLSVFVGDFASRNNS